MGLNKLNKDSLGLKKQRRKKAALNHHQLFPESIRESCHLTENDILTKLFSFSKREKKIIGFVICPYDTFATMSYNHSFHFTSFIVAAVVVVAFVVIVVVLCPAMSTFL